MILFSRFKLLSTLLVTLMMLTSGAFANPSSPDIVAPSSSSVSPSSSFFSEIKDFFTKVIGWVTCSKEASCPLETKKQEENQWTNYEEQEKEVLNEESDI